MLPIRSRLLSGLFVMCISLFLIGFLIIPCHAEVDFRLSGGGGGGGKGNNNAWTSYPDGSFAGSGQNNTNSDSGGGGGGAYTGLYQNGNQVTGKNAENNIGGESKSTLGTDGFSSLKVNMKNGGTSTDSNGGVGGSVTVSTPGDLKVNYLTLSSGKGGDAGYNDNGDYGGNGGKGGSVKLDVGGSLFISNHLVLNGHVSGSPKAGFTGGEGGDVELNVGFLRLVGNTDQDFQFWKGNGAFKASFDTLDLTGKGDGKVILRLEEAAPYITIGTIRVGHGNTLEINSKSGGIAATNLEVGGRGSVLILTHNYVLDVSGKTLSFDVSTVGVGDAALTTSGDTLNNPGSINISGARLEMTGHDLGDRMLGSNIFLINCIANTYITGDLAPVDHIHAEAGVTRRFVSIKNDNNKILRAYLAEISGANLSDAITGDVIQGGRYAREDALVTATESFTQTGDDLKIFSSVKALRARYKQDWLRAHIYLTAVGRRP